MHKILILEDDILFGETLVDFLEGYGFFVSWHKMGQDALNEAYEKDFDLFILDLNLPDMSGFDVLRDLRAFKSKPAMFLTSRSDKESLLLSFKLGGDEFLSKPVDFDELLARVYSLLKRSGQMGLVELFDGFSFDLSTKTLYENKKVIELGHLSASLLGLFVANINKVVTKEMIEQELYMGFEYKDSSVRVFIHSLNTALKKRAIFSVRGIGYRFEKK